LNKKVIVFLTAIMIGSIILAGCGGKAPATATAAPTKAPVSAPTDTPVPAPTKAPAAIRQSIPLDPALTADGDTLLACSLIYDGLTMLDASGKVQPALALSWTISDDQMDYIVSLRHDVKFKSGTVFNADAVLANFNRWFDPADPLHNKQSYPGWEKYFLGYKGDLDSNSQPISPFDGVEKVDDYTVLIHLNKAMPDLMTDLAQSNFLMVDPAVLAAQAGKYGTSAETTSGTGAFGVSAWTTSGLDLAPNAAYWGTVPAEPVHINWK
jgi:peptide/nickel transport system substrate-binding protein